MATPPTYRDLRSVSDDDLLTGLDQQLERPTTDPPTGADRYLHEMARRQAVRQAEATDNVADAIKLLALWLAALSAVFVIRVIVAILDAVTR